MLGPSLLAASKSRLIRNVVANSPATRGVVNRFVAGGDVDSAVAVTHGLVTRGLTVTIDHLGEDTLEADQALAARESYLRLLATLRNNGLATRSEVSVKLSALGSQLHRGETDFALENAHVICAAAHGAGSKVTLDMEDHTTVDTTLACLQALRMEHPDVGVALQASLRRTEGDIRDLSFPGSRVRLVKGAYAEPRSVAYPRKAEVDQAYASQLAILFAKGAYPMVATHDSTLIALATRLADKHHRSNSEFEIQMLYGVRPTEQQRLLREGRSVRLYLPYGQDWYGYFMRRLAERPANLAFFARSLLSR